MIAHALISGGGNLFSAHRDGKDFTAFTTFLRNKQMNELVCFLMTIRSSFPTRASFYDYAIGAGAARTFDGAAA